MRFIISFFILFSIAPILKAQEQEPEQEEERGKVKFLFGFDSRRSFIEDKVSRVDGIRLGLQLRNPKKRIGLGIYNMRNDIKRPDQKVVELEMPLDTLRLDYGFLSFFYEYVWLSHEKYEVSTPFQFGLGNVERKYIDPSSGELLFLPETGIAIFEVSVASHYKFYPWIGLGMGFGYNAVASSKPELSQAFNSPFYVFKIKLFLGEAYRGIRDGFRKEE